MSFPRYPQYKASGVEWLGDVPAHWTVLPLKRIATVNTGVAKGKDNAGRTMITVPYLRVANVQDGFLNLDEVANIEIPAEELSRYSLRAGDVLMNEGGDFDKLGRGHVWEGQIDPCITQNHVFAVRPQNVRPEWLSTFAGAASAQFYFKSRSKQSTNLASISSTNLMELPVVLPPDHEQAGISAFLAGETAKIDALVAEQERLIELLKEKRQAVISHAVTKGLNPDAPMKPSGIEWLGDVPAHWSVAPLGARYNVQLGKMLDSSKITGQHLRPYLRVFDVQWGQINTDDLPQMDFDDEARERYRLLSGDLLVNEGGSYPGRSAVWQGPVEECYYQKALHRLRPYRPKEDIVECLFYLMSWAANGGVFSAGGNEATIEHLPAEKLRRYRFGFPPVNEQRAIAAFLAGECARFDVLVAEAQRAIDLLHERRTALISAAVTGQIDVRGLVPSEAA